ncbi:MAG: hypothetical protein LBQ13_04285 [Endomicrobium sp.]|jgi:acetyl-CoA carboxylase beta subunit|nr:hypothetical protein [Endomicrobium sp.]
MGEGAGTVQRVGKKCVVCKGEGYLPNGTEDNNNYIEFKKKGEDIYWIKCPSCKGIGFKKEFEEYLNKQKNKKNVRIKEKKN